MKLILEGIDVNSARRYERYRHRSVDTIEVYSCAMNAAQTMAVNTQNMTALRAANDVLNEQLQTLKSQFEMCTIEEDHIPA